MRQRDLSPAPSPIACFLKSAARIVWIASVLHSALAEAATERPLNPLAWRAYLDEWKQENLPSMQARDFVQSLSSMHSHQPTAANQPADTFAVNNSSTATPNRNNQTFCYTIVEKHFLPTALANNATLIDIPSLLPLTLREPTGVETAILRYGRNTVSHGGRNSNEGFWKSVFLHFDGQPRVIKVKVAANRSRQADITISRWSFYLFAVALPIGIALLGTLWLSIGKRLKPKQDRRRISDAYLKRARKIARFGSYKIRISKDSLQESNRWSEEMYSLLRREPERGPMQTSAYIARYVHPEDRSFVTAIYRKAIVGNGVAECEYRVIVPSGEIRHVHDFLEYASSNDTKTVFLGQLHDITEHHRMQQELDRTRAELRKSIAALESLRGKEQKRVAQEMHDDLGQLLAAMKIDLDDLGRSLPSHDTKMQRRLHVLNDLVGAMIVSVRRIVADLPPKGLEDLGLFEALTLMKNNFENRHRLPCHLKLPQELPSLDRKIASAIYRTVQESLSNIVKHANATHVSVELTVDEHHIAVCVTDNGKGLSPDAAQKTDSFGLIGMRERTVALNGEMKLESREGCGTVVQVRLPTNPV